jgi:hypothetical protein
MYRGQLHPGKHEPMVSLEEFDRVQMLLGRKGKPRPKTHAFAFTGAIRCEECDCLYTAIEKTKLIKSTGKLKTFVYYFCTRKKRDMECTQRKHLRVEDLEAQITAELGKLTILPEFRDWALEILRESNDRKIGDRAKVHENLSKAILQTQRQLDNLTGMRYRELITDDEFKKERASLQVEINKLRERLRETEGRADRWLDLTERVFNFATHARQAFLEGDLQTKREIFLALGQNPTIKDGKLAIHANEWLQPIQERYPTLESEFVKLELNKHRESNARSEAFTSLRRVTRGSRDHDGCSFFFDAIRMGLS